MTIRERRAGSKPGLDSSTRTLRPPRATVAAVKNPAADPPTTRTSPLSLTCRGCSSVLGTISLSQVAHTPRTWIRPGARAQRSKKYGQFSARPYGVWDENGRSGNPLSIANPLVRANLRRFASALRKVVSRKWKHFRRKQWASGPGVRKALVPEIAHRTARRRKQQRPQARSQAAADSSPGQRLRHSAALTNTG